MGKKNKMGVVVPEQGVNREEKVKEVKVKAKALAKIDPTWWMSKYLGVYYAYTVVKSGKKDVVASRIYRYASSASENSSVYVKYHD